MKHQQHTKSVNTKIRTNLTVIALKLTETVDIRKVIDCP